MTEMLAFQSCNSAVTTWQLQTQYWSFWAYHWVGNADVHGLKTRKVTRDVWPRRFEHLMLHIYLYNTDMFINIQHTVAYAVHIHCIFCCYSVHSDIRCSIV